MKNKRFFILIFLLFTVLLCACKGEQNVIRIVPHHLNLKVYSYETNVDLAFVSTESVESIKNVTLSFSDDSIGGIDGVDISKYFELDSYKTFHIFIIRLALMNVQGDTCIESIGYDFNNTRYSFSTDIRIQSDFKKDVHFVSGDNYGDVIIPGFGDYGFSHLLKSNKDIEVVKVYFEGTKCFDLNQYISSVCLNEHSIDEGMRIFKDDPFYLEININSDLPRHIMIIDQIIIEYRNNGSSLDFGYVLVPLSLYSTEICSKNFINSIS
jgi:hypothetical protein